MRILSGSTPDRNQQKDRPPPLAVELVVHSRMVSIVLSATILGLGQWMELLSESPVLLLDTSKQGVHRRVKKEKTHSFYTDCSVSATCAGYNGCCIKNERAVKGFIKSNIAKYSFGKVSSHCVHHIQGV